MFYPSAQNGGFMFTSVQAVANWSLVMYRQGQLTSHKHNVCVCVCLSLYHSIKISRQNCVMHLESYWNFIHAKILLCWVNCLSIFLPATCISSICSNRQRTYLSSFNDVTYETHICCFFQVATLGKMQTFCSLSYTCSLEGGQVWHYTKNLNYFHPNFSFISHTLS